MTALDERERPGDSRPLAGAARSSDSVPPVTGPWAEHHGSPCSCGCEPVRGERLAEIIAFARSQIAESPAKRERREREARKLEVVA